MSDFPFNPVTKARFHVGQIVHHALFGYRGVVFDVDAFFSGTDEWYDEMAKSRPPRGEPWYHVMVHDEGHTTYVAERNLEADTSGEEIFHPALDDEFAAYENGQYTPLFKPN